MLFDTRFNNEKDFEMYYEEFAENIELLEDLEELPGRDHKLSLSEQIIDVLIIKPLHVLRLGSLPQNLVYLYKKLFPSMVGFI